MILYQSTAKEMLNKSNPSNDDLPLELQALIRSARTFAIIMVIISIISVYFIPWAVFYIILASKLKSDKLPSKKLIKGAAIATLPLCLGLIPILIDAEFWRLNRRLKEYEKERAKAFISDKEFLAGEPKRKRRGKITWVILLIIVAIFGILIVVAISSDNNSPSSNTSNTPISLLTNKTLTPYNSVEHGFKVNFPGFPEIEREILQFEGYSIPYTSYTKDTDGGEVAYLAAVYDYSGLELNEKGALEGAVNGAVQNTPGASLISSNFTTYKDLNAIDAYYTALLDSKTYNAYIKGFIKSGKMYSLFSFGATKTEFDNFVGSFSFTQ
jgi:uncharacterized membrane protein